MCMCFYHRVTFAYLIRIPASIRFSTNIGFYSIKLGRAISLNPFRFSLKCQAEEQRYKSPTGGWVLPQHGPQRLPNGTSSPQLLESGFYCRLWATVIALSRLNLFVKAQKRHIKAVKPNAVESADCSSFRWFQLHFYTVALNCRACQ